MLLRMSVLASNLQAAIGEGLAARRARRNAGAGGPRETRAEICPTCMEEVTSMEWRWPVCGHVMHEECWHAFLGPCTSNAEAPRCPRVEGEPRGREKQERKQQKTPQFQKEWTRRRSARMRSPQIGVGRREDVMHGSRGGVAANGVH